VEKYWLSHTLQLQVSLLYNFSSEATTNDMTLPFTGQSVVIESSLIYTNSPTTPTSTGLQYENMKQHVFHHPS